MPDRPAHRSVRVAFRVPAGPVPAYVGEAVEAVACVTGADVVLIIRAAVQRPSSPIWRRLLDRTDTVYEWVERQLLRGGLDALAPRADDWTSSETRLLEGSSDEEQRAALDAVAPDVLIDLMPDDGLALTSHPSAGVWCLRYSIGVGAPRQALVTRPRTETALAESLMLIEHELRPADRDGARGERAPSRGLRPRPRCHLLAICATAGAKACALDPSIRQHPRCDRAVQFTIDAGPTPRYTNVFGAIPRAARHRAPQGVRSGHLSFGMVRDDPPPKGGSPPPRDLSGFTPVAAPAGRFYADPFVVSSVGGPRLYVEDCPVGRHQGRITVLADGGGGQWHAERTLLDDIEHRAYPSRALDRDGTGHHS